MPEAQPQVATTPQKHNWKKVGLTILIILVVSGLLVGGYWYYVQNQSSESDLTGPVPKVTTPKATESAKEATESAEEDETADWKTLKDSTNCNVEIKHPPSWVVEEPSGDIKNYTISSPDYSGTHGVANNGTHITLVKGEKYNQAGTLNNYAKNNFSDSLGVNFNSSHGVLKETVVDGNKAVRMDLLLYGVYPQTKKDFVATEYYLLDKNEVCIVTRIYPEGEQDKYEETFKKVINAIKFL